jgi:SnoaL-like domain
MKEPREIWQSYTEAWKAESVEEKRALFETCLAPACAYTDPTVALKGWDALTEYMVALHQQIPGGHFVVDEFIAHHRCSVARWRMLAGDGTKMGDGISYGEYDESGMLVAMTGFWNQGAPS